MIPMRKMSRRSMLRGMMGSAVVTVGLPFLDCFLNANGTALASGAPLPLRFGTWFWGLGMTPGEWEPKTAGAKYEMREQMRTLAPFRDKLNIYSGMKATLDGHPLQVHTSGQQVILGGSVQPGPDFLPSIDSVIADKIGTRTRFRSLEVSCNGSPLSQSRRGGSVVNPGEISLVALYTRIFGADIQDPNAADFKPDPRVLLRRSALSALADQRESLVKQIGAADRTRLDEYFTSLRELEQQLDLQMQKPAPLEACTMADKSSDAQIGSVIDNVLANHKLFAGLLAHALACGQTQVINVMLSGGLSNLRKASNPMTMHIYSHEEANDPKLGYQAMVAWFQMQCMDGFRDMLAALDGIKEGDSTLLDRSLLLALTDHGYAKVHGLDNIPLLTAGSAGGRIKTGIHVQSNGDPVTRVGLTIQQVMGLPLNNWGTESNRTARPITEILA